MKHALTAAALAAVFAPSARAQPPAPGSPANPQPPVVVVINPSTGSQFLPIGPPPPLPSLNVVFPGIPPTPGPPIPPGGPGFYKSGGVMVGLNGAYPYDSGVYLLGGMDGLARVSGTFTMVPTSGGSSIFGCGASGCGGGSDGYVAGRCRSCSFLHPFKK